VANVDCGGPHRARGGGVGDPLGRHDHGRGFGLVGAPLTLIDALVESSDADELTIVSNNMGEPGRGLGRLLRQGQIKRGISSYFTSNPEAVVAVNSGAIEATLVPQGTFAEAIRAGGAGIPGFFTPVGAGTLLAEGKEERVIDGVPHVLEQPIRADVSLVYAARGDELGNLQRVPVPRSGTRVESRLRALPHARAHSSCQGCSLRQ